MLEILNLNGKNIVIKKDGNRIGSKKRYKLIKEFMDIVSCFNTNIFVEGYNKYPKDKCIWSVYGIGDVNPELNSYLLTFEEAVKMVFDSLVAGEFEEYLIHVYSTDLKGIKC